MKKETTNPKLLELPELKLFNQKTKDRIKMIKRNKITKFVMCLVAK